jgi:hypothetical protein
MMVAACSYLPFSKRLWAWLLLLTHCQPIFAQGFIRTYPQKNAEFYFNTTSSLPGGHALLHGTSGPLGYHTRNMRVDENGDTVWIWDYRHLTVEYSLGRASIGDSIFFDAGITSANQQVMSDPFLMCYDAQGQLRWFRQYESAAYDQFTGLAMSSSGSFYGIGVSEVNNSGIHTAFLMKMNSQGDSVWRRDYADTLYNEASPSGIAVLPNGDVLFGLVYPEQIDGYHLLRLDSLGNLLTDRPYLDRSTNCPFWHVQWMSNGNLLCRDWFATICEYTPGGDLLHSFRADDDLGGVTELIDGGFLLNGRTASQDFFLQKLNPDWTVAWRRDYELPDDNFIGQVQELPSRELLLAGGRFTNVLGSGEGLLLRTDCEGNLTDYTHCLPPGPEYALWPNPSDGHATLSIPEAFYGQPHTIQVFNALGQVLFSQRVDQMQFLDLDLGEVSPGVVFLRVSRAGEAVWQRPWLIQR